jgi:uncharacterized protein (TIGR02611 family)
VPTFIWVAFGLFIVAMVMLDLGVFHRRAHVVTIPEALAWTATWIALAMAFNVAVYFMYSEGGLARPALALEHLSGAEAAMKFFGGYLTEKSLSIDNIFVIAMVFAYFGVPLREQHRLLIWGVLGAIVLRGLMIAGGVVLVQKFGWMNYVFGGLLLFSAARMLAIRHDNIEPSGNLVVRAVKRILPLSGTVHGGDLIAHVDGKWTITPLMLALIFVETADVLFAIDSIPAIFAITSDPFLIWTSNVFAILGLRSMYFALAGMMHRFRYLKTSLVFLLAFVGTKLMLADVYEIPILASIAMIAMILLVGILASVFAGSRDSGALLSPLADELERLRHVTLPQGRRAIVLLIGSSVLIIGGALLVLPGPGWPFVALGIVILSLEFVWARRWLGRIRHRLAEAGRQIGRALHHEKDPPSGA